MMKSRPCQNSHHHITSQQPACSDINDPGNLCVDLVYDDVETVSHVIEADNSDLDITFGPQQVANEDTFSDTLIYEPDEAHQRFSSALPSKTLVIHYLTSFSDCKEIIVSDTPPSR